MIRLYLSNIKDNMMKIFFRDIVFITAVVLSGSAIAADFKQQVYLSDLRFVTAPNGNGTN